MVRKIFVFLLFTQIIYYSQSTFDLDKKLINESTMEILESDALLSLNTTYNLLISPYHFDQADITMAGIIITMTGASLSLDNRLREDVLKTQNSQLEFPQ